MRPFLHLALLEFAASSRQFCSGTGMLHVQTSAEAAAAEEQKALNRGILMLAIPSVVIFGGLSIFAVRYRSKTVAEGIQRDKKEGGGLL